MLSLAQQPISSQIDQVAPYLFYACAALVCASSWAIVISQNIVRMSVYLLLTLTGIAGFYFMLAAELLVAIQLIVYAGGTLILIIFGVMLTSASPSSRMRAKPTEFALGIFISLVLIILLVFSLAKSPWERGPTGAGGPLASVMATQPSATAPGPTVTGAVVVAATPAPMRISVAMLGRSLLSDYLVPFEVSAVLLLVVMIGAAYMARKRA